MLDELGSPGHLQPLPDRLGDGVLDAVPDVQALHATRAASCDPLVISWPKGIEARGEVRHQYHHCTDIVPTILECCGLEMPDRSSAATSRPRCPACRCATRFDDADAPTAEGEPVLRDARHPRHLARGLEGRRRSTRPSRAAAANFDKDTLGAVPHRRGPLRGARPGRRSTPRSSRSWSTLWFDEAGKNDVLPLDDRSIEDLVAIACPWPTIPRGRHLHATTRGRRRCPESSPRTSAAARTRSSPTSSSPTRRRRACIFAHGSRFGGHALFIKDRKLWYVYNFLGHPARAAARLAGRAPRRGARARRGVLEGEPRRARRGASAPPSCTSTTSRSPRATGRPSPATSRSAARA